MKPNLFIRLVVIFLVPCLIADPTLAASFQIFRFPIDILSSQALAPAEVAARFGEGTLARREESKILRRAGSLHPPRSVEPHRRNVLGLLLGMGARAALEPLSRPSQIFMSSPLMDLSQIQRYEANTLLGRMAYRMGLNPLP